MQSLLGVTAPKQMQGEAVCKVDEFWKQSLIPFKNAQKHQRKCLALRPRWGKRGEEGRQLRPPASGVCRAPRSRGWQPFMYLSWSHSPGHAPDAAFMRLPGPGRRGQRGEGVSAITVTDCLQLRINLSKGLRSGGKVLGGSAKFLKTFLFLYRMSSEISRGHAS